MNNDECVLLNFSNEELRVGFRIWIVGNQTNEKVSDSWLDEAIRENKTVEVVWPDCHVEPAMRMKYQIKRCGWTTKTAKIIAYGGKND